MNREIADLQKIIKERVKKSNSIARANRGNKLGYKLLLFNTIIFGLFNFGLSAGQYLRGRNFTSDFWFYLLISLALFVQSLVWRSMLIPPPLQKKDFEKWVWKGYREQIIYWGVIYLIIAIAAFLSPSLFGKYQNLAVGTYCSFTLFVFCLIAVLLRPKLFMSSFLGIIGKIAFWSFFLFMPFRIVLEIAGLFDFLFKISDVKILIMAISFFILFLPFFFGFRDRNLNEVQYFSSRILEPDKLFISIRPYEKELEDKYEALKVKFGLDKELSYGVKIELVNLYAQEHKNKSENIWFITAMLAVFGFLIQSLFQPAIEDVVYAPFIKPILEKILIYLSK